MRGKILPFKDTKWISLYFSIIFLSFFVGIIFNNMDKLIPKFDEVSGTVYGYTQDSVYVDVNWSLSYNYNSRQSEYTEEEFENIIEGLMTDRINMLLCDIHFFEYIILKEHPIKTNDNGIKIKMFN